MDDFRFVQRIQFHKEVKLYPIERFPLTPSVYPFKEYFLRVESYPQDVLSMTLRKIIFRSYELSDLTC